MELTQQQLDIVHMHPEPGQLVLINSAAGSGKTTTLTEFCKKNSSSTILLISFGKADAQDAQKRLQGQWHVSVRTFDSIVQEQFGRKIGWGASPWVIGGFIARNWDQVWKPATAPFPKRYLQFSKHASKRRKTEMTEGKSINPYLVQRDISNHVFPILQATYAAGITPTAENAECFDTALGMLDPNEESDSETVVWFKKDPEMCKALLVNTHVALHASSQLYTEDGFPGAMVEFARMVVSLRSQRIDQSILICDEVQDLNLNMLRWCDVQSHTFRVMCGDPYQHIFQFQHTKDGFAHFNAQETCTQMGLEVSFRFGSTIASKVNELFHTHIRGEGSTPGKLFWNVPADKCVLRVCNQKHPTAFLSRTNRKMAETLVTIYTVLNRRASIFGDAAESVYTTFGRPKVCVMGVDNLEAFEREIERCKKLGAKAYHRHMSEIKTGFEQWLCKDFGWSVASNVLTFLKSGRSNHGGHSGSPGSVLDNLGNAPFTNDRRHALFTLSSVHRYKGKECGCVHVADDVLKCFMSETNDKEEGRNILYTSMTRPISTLMFAFKEDELSIN